MRDVRIVATSPLYGRIRATLASLDEAQRAALNLAEVDGQPYLNHWYVLIAATST